MTPVARLSVSGVALFAKIAAILAHISVNTIHNIHTVISGIPPIAKCDTAPVRAVNVIINTLSKYGGKDKQHHHPAAGTDEATYKAN